MCEYFKTVSSGTHIHKSAHKNSIWTRVSKCSCSRTFVFVWPHLVSWALINWRWAVAGTTAWVLAAHPACNPLALAGEWCVAPAGSVGCWQLPHHHAAGSVLPARCLPHAWPFLQEGRGLVKTCTIRHLYGLIWTWIEIDQYGYLKMVILVSIVVDGKCLNLMRWNGVTMQVPPEARRILKLMNRASTWLSEAISGSAAWQQLYPAAEWHHFWVETFQLITSIFCLITKTNECSTSRTHPN